MNRIVKKAITIIGLIAICGVSNAFAANATNIPKPNVKPVRQAYILAQGIITAHGLIGPIGTTDKRCTRGTKPFLRTSLNGTYVNRLYEVKGIANTLTLNPSNYSIAGDLHMDNAGTFDNSDASANWQIWCEPI